MKINNLIKNPFVIAGGIGLLVFIYMKMQDKKKALPTPTKEPAKEDKPKDDVAVEEPTSKFDGLPEEFFKDVEKMSKEELKHTIKLNSGLAKRKKMKKAEKENIKLMLQYLKEEYAKK